MLVLLPFRIPSRGFFTGILQKIRDTFMPDVFIHEHHKLLQGLEKGKVIRKIRD